MEVTSPHVLIVVVAQERGSIDGVAQTSDGESDTQTEHIGDGTGEESRGGENAVE
jgi:hypothetical protein